MSTALQRASIDVPIAESSAMALSNNTNRAAQAGSHIAPSLGLFNDYFLDFQTTAQSLTSTLYGEFEAIFSRIDIHDISPSHLDKPSKVAPRPASKSHHPTYIEPAYHWLLANIHNPYPPKEVRAEIARKAKSDIKSVEAWFVDARSRIGWNTLRRTHFGNKRADIVDAATRFFVQFDERRPLDTPLELEFAQVENSAKNLYADKFVETTLAAKLDVAVKDLTPEMKIQAKIHAREEELKRQRAASSYPSPLHSPDRSPEPVEFPPLDQDVVPMSTPPVDALTGTKRRTLSPEGDDSASSDRPAKRVRLESPPLATTCLPSPTPSSHEPLRSSSPLFATESTPSSITSRKRRLSDADCQSAQKQPQGVPAGPRFYMVSDPLSTPSNSIFDSGVSDLDNWFDAHFGSLSSVKVDYLDDTQGLDLGFYTYSTSDVNVPLTSTESFSETSPKSLGIMNDKFSNDLEIPQDSFNYNELFEQSLFIHQDYDYQASGALPAPQPLLSDFSCLTNLPDCHVYEPASVTTTGQSTIIDPTVDVDWNSSTFVQSAFDVTDRLEDLDRNVSSPISIFSEINTHMRNTVVPRVSIEEGKAEIQLRLAAMKEEMRGLEERLAQSSS